MKPVFAYEKHFSDRYERKYAAVERRADDENEPEREGKVKNGPEFGSECRRLVVARGGTRQLQ